MSLMGGAVERARQRMLMNQQAAPTAQNARMKVKDPRIQDPIQPVNPPPVSPAPPPNPGGLGMIRDAAANYQRPQPSFPNPADRFIGGVQGPGAGMPWVGPQPQRPGGIGGYPGGGGYGGGYRPGGQGGYIPGLGYVGVGGWGDSIMPPGGSPGLSPGYNGPGQGIMGGRPVGPWAGSGGWGSQIGTGVSYIDPGWGWGVGSQNPGQPGHSFWQGGSIASQFYPHQARASGGYGGGGGQQYFDLLRSLMGGG